MWPENWEAFKLFCKVQTQWRWEMDPMGNRRRLGLDYSGVRARMSALRGVDRAALWDQLQVMEFAALEAASSDE